MFTSQDLQNMNSFLGRAQISGDEASTLINLRQKVVKVLMDASQKPQNAPEQAKAAKPKEATNSK